MPARVINTTGADCRLSVPSGSWVGNQAAFSIIQWFQSPSNAAGSAFAALFDGAASFPASLDVQMNTSGALFYFMRDDASNNFSITTATGFDDSQPHCVFIVKRSATDHELYLDWVSQGTSATSIGTLTPLAQSIGGNTNNLPNTALLGRAMLWRRALTLAEAMAAAYYGMRQSGGDLGVLWLEMGLTNRSSAVEPDLSGSGNDVTAIGSGIGLSSTAWPYSLGQLPLNAGTRPRPFAPGVAR